MTVQALIVLIGLIHVYFLVLEMFLWSTPFGLKTFGQTLEKARESAVLAANQGLYNGFLAAGLFWSLCPSWGGGRPAQLFFLGCVLVAGTYGGMTANRKIFFIQALPAAITLGLVIFGV